MFRAALLMQRRQRKARAKPRSQAHPPDAPVARMFGLPALFPTPDGDFQRLTARLNSLRSLNS